MFSNYALICGLDRIMPSPILFSPSLRDGGHLFERFQAINCLATFILSLRDARSFRGLALPIAYFSAFTAALSITIPAL
jgi:hypothetical protein